MIPSAHPQAGAYAWFEELAEVLESQVKPGDQLGFPQPDMAVDAKRARQLLLDADRGDYEGLQGPAAQALRARWGEAMRQRLT